MIVDTVRGHGLPVVKRAHAWLAERSARERTMLLILGGLGIVAVGWYGVVQPLVVARQTAVARIELYESLQARLRAAPAGAPSAPGAAPVTGPLDEAARQVAAAHALTAEVVGDPDRISVTLRNARFDSAVAFVDALERGGSTVDDLRMEAVGQPGLINLTLIAERP